MKLRNFSILACTLFFFSCGNKLLKEAESAYGNYEYSSASKLYENYLKTTKDNAATLHLADCYRHMNRHAEAAAAYEQAINTPEATPSDKLHYAEVLQEQGKYPEAAAVLGDYLQSNPGDPVATNRLSACQSSGDLLKEDPFFLVSQAQFTGTPVNSYFSPFILGDKIYITSASAVKTGMKTDNFTGNGFLDIYVADANTLACTPLTAGINTDLHESNAVITPDGKTMYFTRSRTTNNKPGRAKNNDNHLELCSASNNNGAWGMVISLPFNSTEYSCGHPAISADGKRLFFISDMPGGKGGTDIWYSDITEGTYSTPVNAGEKINTGGNEMFPTVHADKEFYYSTDGAGGAGGLDLFRCELTGGLPQNPKRMSAPFNSSGDDFGVVFMSDNRSGYFCSNREMNDGSDKVYRFSRREPKFFVKATIIDKVSREPLINTSIEVKDLTAGKDRFINTDNNGSIIFSSDTMIDYGFCVHRTEYFACFGGTSVKGFRGSFSDTTYITLTPEKIVINKAIRLENIYYDYNKWNIRPDAAIELDKLVKIMQDNPQISIELSSHTDSRGGDNFNMKLSQKRAQAAVDYIISKGISKDRIVAKGYGESVPLNRCTNGVKCNEDEFQLNRRTEFKVTKLTHQ